MKFTPKKQLLKEAEANPLDVAIQDSSADDQYKQAILKAIASEVNAEVEYEQILQLEDKVSKDLKELFHDTLVDIKEEEIKHIAQLTTKSAQRQDMSTEFKKGVDEAESGEDKDDVKESAYYNRYARRQLKENVEANRYYDSEKVKDTIIKVLNLDIADEKIEKIFYLINWELTAQQVDELLAKVKTEFKLNDAKIDQLENAIIATEDPYKAERRETNDTLRNDIETISNIIPKLHNKGVIHKVQDLITDLERYLED